MIENFFCFIYLFILTSVELLNVVFVSQLTLPSPLTPGDEFLKAFPDLILWLSWITEPWAHPGLNHSDPDFTPSNEDSK